MNIEQKSFLEFLGASGVHFVIPSYQRIYTWSDTQCEELWLDILRAGRFDRNHFLGTVLYSKEHDDKGERLAIIDGQQRMTSVSLIILALCRYASEHPDSNVDPEVLKESYLRVPASTGESSLKLTPSHYDIDAYLAAVENRDPSAKTTISRNLELFESKMTESSFDMDELKRGLDNLAIIAVEVEDEAKAQSIFESINSKGVPLNVADMIRNYLLLAESHDEQTRMYEEYWKPSQEMFEPDPGSLRLNAGIKSWISIRLKGARILSAEQVYSSFKKFAEDNYQGDKESILRELRGFCLMWAENYRFHGTKKYKSGSAWAEIGAPSLTAGYELKKADNEEYAERVRQQLKNIDTRW